MNVITNKKPVAEFNSFNGMFSRGSETSTPKDHLTQCANCSFLGDNQVSIRERLTIQNNFPNKTVISFFIARTKIGPGLLTLTNNGELWDETHAKFLGIFFADELVGINAYGRAYISFKKNGKALPYSYIHYYDGINFREASIQESLIQTFASAQDVGIVDIGNHSVSVSFINENGALSPPAPHTVVYADGTNLLKITLPIGPVNCVARQILVSKANEEELFFGPVINNNTDSFFDYNDFDTTLITSADYLYNILNIIPSCSAMKFYKGRIVLVGQWPAPDDILISRQNEPETFDIVNGIVHLPVSYGMNTASGGLVIRSVLYVTKPNSTFSIQDNGSEPASWGVDIADSGIGGFDSGISVFESDLSAQDVLDSSLVCNKRGLIFFNGAYSDTSLSWKIESLWQRIDPNLFHQVRISHDVWTKRVYVAVPLRLVEDKIERSQTNDIILMMDYAHSLSPSTVKWSIWNSEFINNIRSLSVENFTLDLNQTIYQLAFCNGGPNIWKLNALIENGENTDFLSPNNTAPINQFIITAPIILGGITTFSMINLEVRGLTFLDIKLYSKLRTFFVTTRGFNLRDYFTNLELQRLINFQDEGLQIRLSGSGFILTRLEVYGTVMYNMRPALLEQS